MALTPTSTKFPSVTTSSVWNEGVSVTSPISSSSPAFEDSSVSSSEPSTQSTWEWLCSLGRSVWEAVWDFFQYWFGGGRREPTPSVHSSPIIEPLRTRSASQLVAPPINFSEDKSLSRTKSASQLGAAADPPGVLRRHSDPVPGNKGDLPVNLGDPSPPSTGRDPSPLELASSSSDAERDPYLVASISRGVTPIASSSKEREFPREEGGVPVIAVPLQRAIPAFSAKDNERAQHLLDFYQERKTDEQKRTLESFRDRDDNWMENTHDYIQWLFPSPYPSQAEPEAPRLTRKFVETFQQDGNMQYWYGSFLNRMMRFYGLQKLKDSEGNVVVVRSKVFWNLNYQNWLWPNNHNFLRLSRILTSMKYLEYEPELRQALYHTLIEIADAEGKKAISPRNRNFWRAACYAPTNNLP